MGNAVEKFKRAEGLLQCPLCGEALRAEDHSLKCGNAHCYDISAKGYVNFRPAQKQTFYDRALFIARRNVLEGGLYDCVADAVDAAFGDMKENAVVLDAGCGEGFFMRRLERENGYHLAVDIEKEAVQLAAKGGGGVCWMVADIAALPVVCGGVDAVINILSPANYGEFNRVLKDDGLIIKVVPGREHLQELRQEIDIENVSYRNDDVVTHFMENTRFLSGRRITERKMIADGLRKDFFAMTPLTRNMDIQESDLKNIDTVTVDFEILAGGKK